MDEFKRQLSIKRCRSGLRCSPRCCHGCICEYGVVTPPQDWTGGGNWWRGRLFVFGGGFLHHGRDHHGERRDGLPTLSPSVLLKYFQMCLVLNLYRVILWNVETEAIKKSNWQKFLLYFILMTKMYIPINSLYEMM